MIYLPKARDAWNRPGFDQILKRELEEVDCDTLPLQQGLTFSSMVSPEPFYAIILESRATKDTIFCKVSIIFAGIIAGCSCADDPTPINSQAEHCELLLEIDQESAETRVTLLQPT
jgi:hypothetical protein